MTEPAIQFGTASKFGSLTGWVANNPTITVTKERANALGPTGNEVASKLHNEMTECTQEFVSASSTTPPTIPPNLGVLMDSAYILTSIALSTGPQMVTMTLTGHNHTDNAHADTLQRVAHGITLSKAFGGIDFFGGTAGDNADVESSTLTIECQHNDVMDADGDHLVGENFDARVSGSVVWHGVPTTPVGAGWDMTSKPTSEENTGFLKTTVTAEKALTMAPPPPP
jgi:hypothetical protein